ncbi:MAG: hypothetical protein ACJKTH_01135 [Patescibacteria group bacterium UBA2163]
MECGPRTLSVQNQQSHQKRDAAQSIDTITTFNTEWPETSTIPKREWHFCKKLYERYGRLVLGPGELDSIRSKTQVIATKEECDSQSKEGRLTIPLERKGVIYYIRILYNALNYTLITALPPGKPAARDEENPFYKCKELFTKEIR